MTKIVITEELKTKLSNYLKKNSSAELLNVYLYFIENNLTFNLCYFQKKKKFTKALLMRSLYWKRNTKSGTKQRSRSV